MYDKIKGALMGVAVGDALGATLEFTVAHSPNIDEPHNEIIGGGVFKWQAGEPTDDTDMTIAVAEGIMAKPDAPMASILANFKEWAAGQPKDIGGTVGLALDLHTNAEGMYGGATKAHALLNGRTAGNGSLMRTIPVALAYYNDMGRVEEISRLQSRLTHYDTKASNACIIYNKLIVEILNATEHTKEQLVGLAIMDTAYDIPYDKISYLDLKPSGYVVDSLICALWIFLNTDSFEDGLIKAVNLGGDADTIGAITGGILGAFYGFNAIPSQWANKLQAGGHLMHIAQALYGLKGGINI